ncbi:hypothetical protein BJ508DRAFT_151971 [Ascobolus immersus RN42]|uniref:Uncharacterized protein n=1 Tax=Ascobolus immersus RN42 TaxID=1160509 RepID=A0A3N4IAU3_ASCIM|nr:hypothetical protein BJ508DRAFT_151971 [Ascobolus immersus RN42]
MIATPVLQTTMKAFCILCIQERSLNGDDVEGIHVTPPGPISRCFKRAACGTHWFITAGFRRSHPSSLHIVRVFDSPPLSMAAVYSPINTVPGYQHQAEYGSTLTEEPTRLQAETFSDHPSDVSCRAETFQPQLRPVFFKARKLSSVANLSLEKELTKPEYQGELSKEKMREAVGAIASKMHWAIQVGERRDSQTYELQRTSTGSDIVLVSGQWTKQEKDMQITKFVKNELVGYTAMTDSQVREASHQVIEFMRLFLSTNGKYDEIYCNCQHFVYLLIPAITNGDTRFFENPYRLPYKWKKLLESPETRYMVSHAMISTIFKGLSSFAVTLERTSPSPSSPTESYTSSSSSIPSKLKKHRFPHRSSSQRSAKGRRWTDPSPSSSMSIVHATAFMLQPELVDLAGSRRSSNATSTSDTGSEAPILPATHSYPSRTTTNSSKDSDFTADRMNSGFPSNVEDLINTAEFAQFIKIVREIRSRMNPLRKMVRSGSTRASVVTGMVTQDGFLKRERTGSC